MDKVIYDRDKLYDEVYLFFSKNNSNNIVSSYLKKGLELLFSRDYLTIKTNSNEYLIKVIQIKRINYFYVYSNIGKEFKIKCNNGNLEDVFEKIMLLD